MHGFNSTVEREPLALDIRRDISDLAELADDWTALLGRHPRASVAQGPVYCTLAALHACPDNAQLAVVVASRGHNLAGIWPLWIVRERGLRIARHIGGGSNEEYAGPLADASEILAAMLELVRAEADVIQICNLPGNSPLLSRLSGLLTHKQAINSPVVRCGQHENFDAWLAARSRNFRQGLRSERRRLGEQGDMRIGKVPTTEIEPFVEWLFDSKCAWADANNLAATWLRQPAARTFAKAAMAQPGSGVVGHAIWVDGMPIAGTLSLVGNVYEYFVTTYDPAFARLSPGHVLTGELVAEAIAAGVDFDFRITHDSYKMRWIDDFDARVTLTIATTRRAWPVIARLHLKSLRRAAGHVVRSARQRLARQPVRP